MHFLWVEHSGLIVRHNICEQIYKNSTDKFCVFANKVGIHIVSVSKNDELVYIVTNQKSKKECILCRLPKNTKIDSLRLAESSGMMNLFFTAEYGGGTILVHCVLGKNSRPEILDKTPSKNFFVFGTNIYYTNQKGVLGRCDFSDGKPSEFVPISTDAEDAYLYIDGKEKYIVFRKKHNIFVNGKCVPADKGANLPILVKRADKLLLMWNNGEIVKYVDLKNTANIRQIMSSGKQDLIFIQKDKIYYDYLPPKITT